MDVGIEVELNVKSLSGIPSCLLKALVAGANATYLLLPKVATPTRS